MRHGIWNAEMTVLIGKERAELFATAHEDKDVTGTESDGYPKTAHRDMDLHNNEVGREIGEKIKKLQESELLWILFIRKYIPQQHHLYGYMNQDLSRDCTARLVFCIFCSN